MNIYTEEPEYCNSNTAGNKILKDGEHVGWRISWWTLGVKDSFESNQNLTKAQIESLRRKYPWITGTENEDNGFYAGCDSWHRFSVLVDILGGNAPLNAAIA